MHLPSHIILAIASLSAASAQHNARPAETVTDNPEGAVYLAAFRPNEKSSVSGYVLASSGDGGNGVNFAVKLSGLPTSGGPFMYHIHDAPVPPDGSCAATLAHLDPYQRGEVPDCDTSEHASCQVGDLSGKFGHITSTSYESSYLDDFVSLKPGLGSFFGNRSMVIHLADKTRIACSNFVPLDEAIQACLPSNSHPESPENSQPASSTDPSHPASAEHPPNAPTPSFNTTIPLPTKPSPVPFTGAASAPISMGSRITIVTAFILLMTTFL